MSSSFQITSGYYGVRARLEPIISHLNTPKLTVLLIMVYLTAIFMNFYYLIFR